MSTMTLERTLRIYHGAGRIYEVPGDVVPSSGKTLAALQQIATDHIRDPELLRTLADPRLVLQFCNDDPTTDVHQQLVSPQADFSQFAELLKDRAVEMAASIRHEGGSHDRVSR